MIPGRNPPFKCTLTLITMQGHKTKTRDNMGLDMQYTIHDCSPIPVIRLFIAGYKNAVEMALFGLFAALIKGCRSYGRNGGQPTRGDS